ncbi:hypothetical protein LAZ67_4000679 [Cordylochernes scorpioides]|uniref:DDE-1 domain-containing protein n=1 Tax=Cordylochernes scorpioides TaxID=51811 RepID=A0ABY6KBP2_9ARAC|nr:hypothetical protein LAZ67_4000679 [Cordylochernes scorpioides]
MKLVEFTKKMFKLLHWVNELSGALKQIFQILRPDGALIGCMYSGDTLYQLRGALQLAELEREGGIGSHISPFVDQRELGGLLSSLGYTLLTLMKALKFYKELKESEPSTSSRESNPQFSASTGWLTGFIKRHSFHNLKIKGEVASADEEAARKYPEKLAKIIKDGGYCAHQIFNADETGLFWKKMPTRTYIAKSEKNASGFKAAKDRVTLLLCSNASGDRMLKPLLVNRSLKPRALKGKDLNTLPVHWMANKKAWVTTAIFTEWFNKCFVPEVENYMKEMGLEFKILLILDNAPGDPNLEHPNIKVVFFPPNTTSLIQPLDQGIISTFKKYYVKFTFQFIFDKLESDTITVTEVWKQFNILNCVDHVALAIAEIKSQTLNACWKAAWPECVSKRNESNRTTIVTSDIISIAKEIGGEGFDDFGEHDIEELLVDEALNDDDILESMVDTTKDFETVDSELEDVTPLDEKLLREGLQLSELYKELVKPSQRLITDYLVKEKKITEVPKEALPCRSDDVILSSSDESDLAPIHKWDVDEITINYPSMFELMWDLKGMAENNATWARKPLLHRDTMLAAASIYRELYGDKESIPATFEILYFIGWKPHPSQPKPLQRGSAQISLKDIGKVNQIIKDMDKNSKT